MPRWCYEFVDSRLRRSPPDRASAVPYGQAGENALRFPHLAHRSAAAHKLHSTPQQDRMNLISGNDQTSSRLPAFSLFFPGSCPNNRDRRKTPRLGGAAGRGLGDMIHHHGLEKPELEFVFSITAPLFWILRDSNGNEMIKNGS